MKINPLPIIPLIQQHAVDAAFYWQHVHDSLFSATMEKDDLIAFTGLLSAHIDGLTVAGETGWSEALNNLETWMTNAEAFVCGTLAFKSGNVNYIDALVEMVERSTETTAYGVAEAAKFVDRDALADYLDDWLVSDKPFFRQIAISACAGHRIAIADEIIRASLVSNDVTVKVEICHYLGQMQSVRYLSDLHTMFGDKDLAIREAAALAISWIKPDSPVLFHQLFTVLKEYLCRPREGGTEGLINQQKITRLTRMAGQVLPYSDPRLKTSLSSLPDYLQILFLAHHGDSRTLPRLRELMKIKELSALAFWAIAMITGIDIDEETFLILDDPQKEREIFGENQSESYDSDDDDIDSLIENINTSLILPDVNAVEAYLSSQKFDGNQLLYGRAPSVEHCRTLLAKTDIPLAIQCCSLWHLFRLEPNTSYQDLRIC